MPQQKSEAGGGSPTSALEKPAMMTNATPTQNGTDHRLPAEDVARDIGSRLGYVIGVDAEGSAHVHYPSDNRIEVYDVAPSYEVGDYLDREDIEQTQPLGAHGLETWMAYVEDRRGWGETTHRAPEEWV